MHTIQDLFNEIEEQHSYEACTDPSEIEALEVKYGYPLPADLIAFYRRYKTVRMFDSPFGPLYRFVPISEMHPTRRDIYGEDTDEWGPRTWITICDVLDGNYIAIDIASGSGNQYNYIDCFHETFAEPGESQIIAKSFTELVNSAMRGGGERLFWGIEGFVAHGDGMPFTAQNAAIRIGGPKVKDTGWLMRFRHKDKNHREFFSDRKHGGKQKSFYAVGRYIEEATR
jgi:cell wall assembly regulator SMI1